MKALLLPTLSVAAILSPIQAQVSVVIPDFTHAPGPQQQELFGFAPPIDNTKPFILEWSASYTVANNNPGQPLQPYGFRFGNEQEQNGTFLIDFRSDHNGGSLTFNSVNGAGQQSNLEVPDADFNILSAVNEDAAGNPEGAFRFRVVVTPTEAFDGNGTPQGSFTGTYQASAENLNTGATFSSPVLGWVTNNPITTQNFDQFLSLNTSSNTTNAVSGITVTQVPEPSSLLLGLLGGWGLVTRRKR